MGFLIVFGPLNGEGEVVILSDWSNTFSCSYCCAEYLFSGDGSPACAYEAWKEIRGVENVDSADVEIRLVTSQLKFYISQLPDDDHYHEFKTAFYRAVGHFSSQHELYVRSG